MALIRAVEGLGTRGPGEVMGSVVKPPNATKMKPSPGFRQWHPYLPSYIAFCLWPRANPDCQTIMAKGQTSYTWRKTPANKSTGCVYGHLNQSSGKVLFTAKKKNYLHLCKFIITERTGQFLDRVNIQRCFLHYRYHVLTHVKYVNI